MREPSPPFWIARSTLPILQRWRTRWWWWLQGTVMVVWKVVGTVEIGGVCGSLRQRLDEWCGVRHFVISEWGMNH